MASNTSTTEVPVIQVLEKDHYFTQALVPLPDAVPYPPLAPSSLRLRTKLLSLTSNNFTYAKLGFLFGWWSAYPLPESAPAPYNDGGKYGRINTWGWAEVLESTHAGVPAGSLLWGYQSIGTLAQDVEVRDGAVPGQIVVTSAARQGLMPIYNRYITATGAAADAVRRDVEARADAAGYDSVVRVMFKTAYLLNRYVLTPAAVSPSKIPGAAPWTPEQADIKGATVIVLAPGSKVGLCLAYELRRARGEEGRVARVIGAASEYSKSFVEKTELYNAVVSTAESPVEVLAKLGVTKDEKVVIVDCGGRAGVGASWAKALLPVYEKLLVLGVGSEVSELPSSTIMAGLKAGGGVSVQVNANDIWEDAIKLDGEAKYSEGFESAWESLRSEGIKGLKINWGTGMEDVKAGWDKLAKGEVKPDESLVFVL